MDKNQTIDLREYENPSEDVKNDNTVADTSNVVQDVDNLKKRLVEMGSNKNEDLLKELSSKSIMEVVELVKMLEEEKMTVNDVKESLMNSEEYQTLIILKEFNGIDSIKPETRKVINELYMEILKRPADDDGLLYYSAMFESEKLSLDDIRNELLKSEERSQINLLNENK